MTSGFSVASDANWSPDPREVLHELDRILSSAAFKDEERLQKFLRFAVHETLEGGAARLKESVIGVEVFGRPADYDPKTEPIVRVQARRLRAKLELYYETAKAEICITVPKGSYVPVFAPAPRDVIAPPVSAPAPPSRLKPVYLIAMAGALVMLTAIAVLRGFRTHQPSVWTARPFTAYAGYQTTPAFSPDGMTLAFAWGGLENGSSGIYIQRLDADSPRRLTSSAAPETAPTWLHEGQQIGFLRGTEPGRLAVVVVPVLGTGERVVAQLSGVISADSPSINFSGNGKHLYTDEQAVSGDPLQVVDIDVSTQARHVLTHPPSASLGDDEVALSPDGQWLAFRRRSESSIHDVFVIPVSGGKPRAITHDASGIVGLAWMRDGSALIISSRRRSSLQSLWRFPVHGGEPVRLTDPFPAASYPSVSPKDGSIAYASRFFDSNIWRIDLKGHDKPQRLIESTLLDSSPHYSPDGRRIAFRSNRTGNDELWVCGSDGEAPARLTNFAGPVTGNGHWSPDGQYLAIDSRPDRNADIYVVSAGGGSPRRVATDRENEVLPSFSSDGKFLYFACDRTGTWQIWKKPVSGGASSQITRNGGFAPVESADGRYVYYSKMNAPGVFRLALAGGREEQVLPDLPSSLWGGWALAGDTLFYLSITHDHDQPAEIWARALSSSETRRIAALRLRPVLWDGSLAVSSDARFALVSEVERAGSQIYILQKP